MKRFVSFLLALTVCLTLTSCYAAEPAEAPSVTDEQRLAESIGEVAPLLYMATDADGDRVWLFGSIHIGYKELYPLPSYVMDAFEEADALAVEVDINDMTDSIGAYGDLMKMVSYTDGTTIKDHIDADLYQRAVKILEDHLYVTSALETFKPYIWSSLLDELLMQQSALSSANGVDQHLLDLAYDQGKPIVEVESAEEQFAMLGGFPDKLQEMMLEENVDMYERGTASLSFHMLMALWAKGDEKLFSTMLNQTNTDASADEQEMYEYYQSKLVTERNVTMTDFAEQALTDGRELFICVGAAHVIGEDAMVDLLRERGYTVELVK